MRRPFLVISALAPAAVIVRPVPVEVPPIRSEWVERHPFQPTYPADPLSLTQSSHPIGLPLWLVNSRIILSDGTLREINPQDIKKIIVYKEDKMPASWRLTPNGGIVDMRMKKGVRVPSRSLASLKRQAHLHGPVRFAIDGRLLPDASLRIATSAISRLEVRPAEASGQPAELNILLTKSPPTNYPKERGLMIRGTAGR